MAHHRELEDELAHEITDDDYGNDPPGYYHPSQISGCPLKVALDEMTDNEAILNSWMFAGTAVHYYLQEDGILDRAMERAGYHPLGVDYEVSTTKDLGDGIKITGKCDILAHSEDKMVIYDIKYSSIPPESGHGRLFKYFSQVNIYAHMFGADEFGLIMISSKSRDLGDDISILTGETNDENWEIVKKKVRQVHSLLEQTMGDEWDAPWTDPEDIPDVADWDSWEPIVRAFDKEDMPAFKKECQYCDHSDYCPVKNGETNGGLNSFKGGVD